MTTANLYVLAKPLQPDPGLKERNGVATGQASLTIEKLLRNFGRIKFY